MLVNCQKLFEILLDTLKNQSTLGGMQFLFCTGVIFSHSALTIYYTIKVFVLELEAFSPKLVISIIWWIFLLANTVLVCITNDLIANDLKHLIKIMKRLLTHEKDLRMRNAIFVATHFFSRELKFTSGLIDYNLKLLFTVSNLDQI